MRLKSIRKVSSKSVEERLSEFRQKRSIRPVSTAMTPVVLDTKPSTPPAVLHSAAGLEPNTDPLTDSQARYLLRRIQFGAPHQTVQSLVGMPADQAVDQLLQQARTSPLPDDPSWFNEYPNDFDVSIEWFFQYRSEIMRRTATHGFAEKMMLFWHNHFVTDFFETHEVAPLTAQYVKLLRQNAFGNFQDFVRAIGLDMSMLLYLDGALNEVGAPNENYARELCELFTMGILGPDGTPNYTEQDITEIARALTGYYIDDEPPQFTVVFEEDLHDTGSKTFFGRTGTFGYNDVVTILFEERAPQIAYHICKKIYKEFVYETPPETILLGLAQVFQTNNFEITAVLDCLLKSQHFFEEGHNGAHIKSPIELFGGLLSDLEMGGNANEELFMEVSYVTDEAGQNLLNPPNVAGWPGYRTWLTTASVPARWEASRFLTEVEEFLEPAVLDRFVRAIHNPNDTLAVFRLPVAIVNHFIGIRMEDLAIETISAPWSGGIPIPAEIEQEPAYVHNLTKRMLSGIPWYEWDLNSEEAHYAIRDFMAHVFQYPEFQLS